MPFLADDYQPWGFCQGALTFPSQAQICDYYFYDAQTQKSSNIYGEWTVLTGFGPAPIQEAPGNCYIWLAFTCSYKPPYFRYVQTGSGRNMFLSLPYFSIESGTGTSLPTTGITFLLRQLTFPHPQNPDGTDLAGDVVTAFDSNFNPVFSIREIGNRWALHSYQGINGSSSNTGYDIGSQEPYTYSGNVNLYEEIYYTFTPDGRLTIDKFTPYWSPPGSGAGSTQYIWEESVFDSGWPFTWNSGSRVFANIWSLAIGGVNGGPSNIDGFHDLQVYNTALTQDQKIELENSLHTNSTLAVRTHVPCNTGRWMNKGVVFTPCDGPEENHGGDQKPVPLPQTNVNGLNSGTESYAPTSFKADDTSFNFSFSYTPPSQYPPLSEIQDPSQPPAWSALYPVTPLDYTLYILTQDENGLHQCQADLSQVGTSSNPGGAVLEAALGADYPLASLNGPDTIATTAWYNPNPQNFTGTIKVPAGWQCTGGQFNNSGNSPVGGVISGNNSGSTGSGSTGSGSTGTGSTGTGSGSGITTIDPTAWYNIVNVGSTLCTMVKNSNVSDGTALDQSSCVNGQASQQWQLTPTDSGYYTIASRYLQAVWDVTGGVSATTIQTPLQLWSLSGNFNQQWKVVSQGNGNFTLTARSSSLCADVPGASLEVGVQLDQYTCNSTKAQLFTFNSVTPAAVTPIVPVAPAAPPVSTAPDPSAWYTIQNVNSLLCADVLNRGTTDGTVLDQWSCGNVQANQQWQFTPTDSGYYTITSRYLNAVWDVTGGASATNSGTPYPVVEFYGWHQSAVEADLPGEQRIRVQTSQ